MKKLFLSAAFALISVFSFSQGSLHQGRNQLNFGIGLSEFGVPFYIGIDHSVHPDITLGAEFSYRSYNENYKNYDYHHNIMGFSGNGNYHFNTALNIPRNWDLYAGLNVGFYVWSSPNTYDGSHQSGLGLGAQVGGRYYFSDTIGLNLEFGGGNAFSGGKLGLSFKF